MAKTVIAGLSKSKGVSSSPYTPGWYKMNVQEAEKGESQKGNLKYTFKFQMEEGPEQEDGRTVEGGKYTHFITVTDHEYTIGKLKEFCNACGIRIGSDDGFDEQKTVGKTVWAEMVHEKDTQGVTRAKAKTFLSEEDYAAKGAPEEEV